MALSDGLRTVFLAGVGAIATTSEKSKQVIDDLVKKGEITVEEGKSLNEDLAAKFNEHTSNIKSSFRNAVIDVDKMTSEERDELIAKLQAANKASEDEMKEDAQVFVDETIDAAVGDDTDEQPQQDAIDDAFDAAGK